VPEWGVISMWDVDTIYKVPRMLHEQGLDGLICDKLRINTPPANLQRWDDLVYEVEHPQQRSVHRHGRQVRRPVGQLQVAQRGAAPRRHEEPCAREDRLHRLRDHHAADVSQPGQVRCVLVPGGFGKRGVEGKISGRPLRPRAQGALPGHLPGHAGRHHRIRAPRGRPEERQQHRVRPRNADTR
jgi:CTP synthase